MFAPRGWLKRPIHKRIYLSISSSALFDKRWYRRRNMGMFEKLGDPIWHYMKHGSAQGLNPSESFDTLFYVSHNQDVARSGINPLFHFIEYGMPERRAPLAPANMVFEAEHPSVAPLRIFREKAPHVRITVLIDDNTPVHPVLGDFLALNHASGIADSLGARLRVVRCRSQNIVPSLFTSPAEVLRINKSDSYGDVAYIDGELWIGTSWSTTLSLENHAGAIALMYMILGDEITSANPGVGRILARQVLERNQEILFVSSQEIRTHLEKNYGAIVPSTRVLQPLETEQTRADTPATIGNAVDLKVKEKRTISLFADPASPPTLFTLGVQLLDRALAEGILSAKDWDIQLCGPNPLEVSLLNTASARHTEIRTAGAYWATIKASDILICFDESALTSPVIADSIASQTVSVTNFGTAADFDAPFLFSASSNALEDLLATLKRAVHFADNNSQQSKNVPRARPFAMSDSALREIKRIQARA